MKQEGYDVTGITLKLYDDNNSQKKVDKAVDRHLMQKGYQKILILITKFYLSKNSNLK